MQHGDKPGVWFFYHQVLPQRLQHLNKIEEVKFSLFNNVRWYAA